MDYLDTKHCDCELNNGCFPTIRLFPKLNKPDCIKLLSPVQDRAVHGQAPLEAVRRMEKFHEAVS